MKKMITAILALALMASMMAACGSEKPAETTAAPTTEAVVETTAPVESMEETESLEETEALELTETEKLIESIYANHKEMEIPVISMVLDLNDAEYLKASAGLSSAENVTEVVLSESMFGAQPYSMVVAQVAEGADAAAVAQEMFDNIDQRKWVCVEADTKIAAYTDNVVMFFMIGSDFADMATTDSMVEAFKAAVGTDVTVIE